MVDRQWLPSVAVSGCYLFIGLYVAGGGGGVIPDKVNIAVTPSVGHSCPCTWAKHRYQSSEQYLLPLRPVTDQPMNVITRDHLLLMEQSLEKPIVPQLIKK